MPEYDRYVAVFIWFRSVLSLVDRELHGESCDAETDVGHFPEGYQDRGTEDGLGDKSFQRRVVCPNQLKLFSE